MGPSSAVLGAVTSPWAADVTALVGQSLSPEDPRGSLTLEPQVARALDKSRALEFSTVLVRPFDPYEDFSSPKTRVSLTQAIRWLPTVKTELALSAIALDADRWNRDGYKVRGGLTLRAWGELLPGLWIWAAGGPFYQWNRFRARADGASLPEAGLTETVQLEYHLGKLSLAGALALEQARAGAVWKNAYATSETAEWWFTPSFGAGLRHELLTSVVDDSTGFYRPVTLLDGRLSRVSAFAEWTL